MEVNWEVCSSDTEDAVDYKPAPDRITFLYEKVCEGEIPDLEATIYPKRVVKKESLPDSNNSKESEEQSSDESEKKTVASMDLNEFDFDSQPDKPVKKFKLKRAPVRQQQKKVARMEKVCSDILKYQKMDEEEQTKKS